MLATLILQQAHDLTDEETVNQVAFNIQWHYALHITEESDSAKYICRKTLWNMRSIVVDNALDGIPFEGITDKLAKVFKVTTDHQRIDSVHIKSNMRRLGRIGIFTSSINKFLVNLKRSHKEQFDTVEKDIIDRYLSEKSLECFFVVKPSESAKTLASVSADLFTLVEQFKDHPEVRAMHSHKVVDRVLKEQCTVNLSDDNNPVEVKKPKEIPSHSLQNTSDRDAAYSGHKGQGYQVQVMETYCKDEEAKDRMLNLITHVEVEQVHESDANALIPAIESSKQRNFAPEELLADTLYGGDENCQEAKQKGVKLIVPVMGCEKEDPVSLSDFEVSKNGDIVFCPQGHTPVITKKKKTRHSVAFDSQHCSNCPLQECCPVKQGKKYHYVRYTDKKMRIAKRRAYGQTEEFNDRYRWPAGSEATMSEYDRKTGVKHLRVRGLKAVRFCATLKAIGGNIFRATAVRRAVNGDKAVHQRGLSGKTACSFCCQRAFSNGLEAIEKNFHPI